MTSVRRKLSKESETPEKPEAYHVCNDMTSAENERDHLQRFVSGVTNLHYVSIIKTEKYYSFFYWVKFIIVLPENFKLKVSYLNVGRLISNSINFSCSEISVLDST